LLALDRDALDALLALDAARAHEGPTRMVNCAGAAALKAASRREPTLRRARARAS
jgi:hypothetical protein